METAEKSGNPEDEECVTRGGKPLRDPKAPVSFRTALAILPPCSPL